MGGAHSRGCARGGTSALDKVSPGRSHELMGREGFARRVVFRFVWVSIVVSTAGCMVDDIPSVTDMVTTAKLRAYYGNPNHLRGIEYNRAVGLRFQRDVLGALPGNKVLSSNTKSF